MGFEGGGRSALDSQSRRVIGHRSVGWGTVFWQHAAVLGERFLGDTRFLMPLGLSVLLIVLAVTAVVGVLGILIDKSAEREDAEERERPDKIGANQSKVK